MMMNRFCRHGWYFAGHLRHTTPNQSSICLMGRQRVSLSPSERPLTSSQRAADLCSLFWTLAQSLGVERDGNDAVHAAPPCGRSASASSRNARSSPGGNYRLGTGAYVGPAVVALYLPMFMTVSER